MSGRELVALWIVTLLFVWIVPTFMAWASWYQGECLFVQMFGRQFRYLWRLRKRLW